MSEVIEPGESPLLKAFFEWLDAERGAKIYQLEIPDDYEIPAEE